VALAFIPDPLILHLRPSALSVGLSIAAFASTFPIYFFGCDELNENLFTSNCPPSLSICSNFKSKYLSDT
jgi:hypothetical protein